MNRVQLSILVIAMAVFLSCEKDDGRMELFALPQLMDFEIPPGLNTIESHFFVAPALKSNYTELMIEGGFADEDVVAIEPKFALLSTVFGDQDLEFVRLVEIRVFDPFDPEFTREAFYLDPVPGNTGNGIRPFPGLADLKEILSKPTYGIEVRLIFLRVPSRTFDMRLELEFAVLQ